MTLRLTLAFVLLIAAVDRVTATDVTSCGQTVAPRDMAVLTTDLTCSSSASGVFLGDRSTLDMNGHTMNGGGVNCIGSCTVTGPGTITNVHAPAHNGAGIVTNGAASRTSKFLAQDVDVSGNDQGIVTQARRVTLIGVNASNNAGDGIETFSKTIRGMNVTASNNGATGLDVQSIGSVRMTGLTASGNGWGGLINDGKRTRLIDSTLTGNAWPPFPDEPTMVDIAIAYNARCPRLVNTTCDHSFRDCHVCSGD